MKLFRKLPHESSPILKVLLVDDEDAVRRSLAYFISTRGWQSFVCDHQADIVAMVRKHEVDILLTDYRMPNITGLDLIENLRDAGMTTPAVILSANTYAIDRDRAKRLDVFRIIAKPPDLKQLTHLLIEAATISKQSQK
jgi:CheY-like chemotaxis protein